MHIFWYKLHTFNAISCITETGGDLTVPGAPNIN